MERLLARQVNFTGREQKNYFTTLQITRLGFSINFSCDYTDHYFSRAVESILLVKKVYFEHFNSRTL